MKALNTDRRHKDIRHVIDRLLGIHIRRLTFDCEGCDDTVGLSYLALDQICKDLKVKTSSTMVCAIVKLLHLI